MNWLVEFQQSYFRFIDFLQTHAVEWLVVVSILLTSGVILQSLARNRLLKQRIGELAIVCVLIWLVLSVIPMPRWSMAWTSPQTRTSVQPARGAVQEDPLIANPVAADENGESLARPELRNETRDQQADQSSPVSTARNAAFSTVDLLKSLTRDPSVVGTTAIPAETIATNGFLASAGVVIWLSGSVLVSFWMVIGYLILLRVRTSARPAEVRLQNIFQEIRPDGGPSLAITNSHRTFIAGLLWPRIILPENITNTSSDNEIRCVLLHELAHWHQRDAWGRLIFNLALPLLYFHPCYWLARNQSDLAAELVADHIATESVDKPTYVEALVKLSRQTGHRNRLVELTGCRGAASFFGQRMKLLLQQKTIAVTLSRNAQNICLASACGISMLAAAIWGAAHDEPDDRKIGQLRASLDLTSEITFFEKCAARLPVGTVAFFSVDVAGIRDHWSVEQQSLLSGSALEQTGIGAHPEFMGRELDKILDRLLLKRSDIFQLANGHATVAICPVGEELASVVMIDTDGKENSVKEFLDQFPHRVGGGILEIGATSQGDRYYIVMKQTRPLLFIIPSGDQLILTDHESVRLLNHPRSLAESEMFCAAKQNAIQNSSGVGFQIFAFLKPGRYIAHFFQAPGLERQSPASIILKTLFDTRTGKGIDSLTFGVGSGDRDLVWECFLETKNQADFGSSFISLESSQLSSMAPAGLTGQATFNIDWLNLLEEIAPVIDVTCGTEGTFYRSLENLRADPRGPMVNVRTLLSRFNSNVNFYWHRLNADAPREWMIEIPIQLDVQTVNDDLARLYSTEYEAKIVDGQQYWERIPVEVRDKVELEFDNEFGIDTSAEEFGGAGLPPEAGTNAGNTVSYPNRSFAIHDKRVLVASSPEMLIAMTATRDPAKLLQYTNDFKQVIGKMEINRDDPVCGFWFERTNAGLLGITMRMQNMPSQQTGWRFQGVLQPLDD